MTQGDLVTVVGRHHITLNEQVRGKQVLIKVGRGDDNVIITVPERFVAFAKNVSATTPPVSQDRTMIARDGSVRQTYYGAGEQPWDTSRRNGWAATFACGNIVKYLRRQKNEDDLDKARWYWVELHKMTDQEFFPAERAHAALALQQLHRELTEDEHKRLVPLSEFPEGAVDPSLIPGS